MATQPIVVLILIGGPEGNKYLFSLSAIIFFLLTNWIVFKDSYKILSSSAPVNDLLKEYFWVLFTGLMNIFIFASIYFTYGINNSGEIIVGDWYASIYFSTVTWTTLGYGDFLPIPDLRLIAAFEALMGYMYMAVLMGILLNLSQHIGGNKKC